MEIRRVMIEYQRSVITNATSLSLYSYSTSCALGLVRGNRFFLLPTGSTPKASVCPMTIGPPPPLMKSTSIPPTRLTDTRALQRSRLLQLQKKIFGRSLSLALDLWADVLALNHLRTRAVERLGAVVRKFTLRGEMGKWKFLIEKSADAERQQQRVVGFVKSRRSGWEVLCPCRPWGLRI